MPTHSRAVYLDLFKTFLIAGMVLAHIVQLIDSSRTVAEDVFSQYANFITFAGFLFAFGAGFGYSRAAIPRRGRWKAPAFLYVAYLLSAFGFLILVDGRLTPFKAATLVSMTYLYAYSEYLATFFVLSLLAAYARPFLFRLCAHPLTFFFSLGLSILLSTFKPDLPAFPLLAPMIGYHQGANFPLVQYFPWFVLGFQMVRGRFEPSVPMGALALGASLPCLFFLLLTGSLPLRDPPDMLWVTGAAFVLFLYLLLAKTIANRFAVPSWITLPGRYALFCLVASSLAIFTFIFFLGRQEMSFGTDLLLTIALLSVLGFIPRLRSRVGPN